MAHFADLSPCTYFGDEFAPKLKSIGWIERGEPYNKGEVAPEFIDKLLELLVNPWQPGVFCGFHQCSLCRISETPSPLRIKQKEITMGVSNLFVPADGFLYVAPSLMAHYIDSHEYAPPLEFCSAVLKCPAMRSMPYLKAVAQAGPKFNRNSS